MYRLQFSENKHIDCYSKSQSERMYSELDRVFPEDRKGYEKWIEYERIRYKKTMPLLEKIYHNYGSLVSMDAIKALPYLSLGRSIFSVLGDSFKNDLTKLSFSFQAKYLGMTPWECPGFFNLIPFVEHEFGVYHIEGGMSEISQQMVNVFKDELGGDLRLNSPVKQLLLENNRVIGVEMQNGEQFLADQVVLNADFAYAASNLIPDAENILKKWKPSKLPKKNYSCSTFMIYLALDKVYDNIPHHSIIFSNDYQNNMKNISDGIVPSDPSVYVRNSSINDPLVAPEGKSGIYILVPVPNLIKQGVENANQFWNDKEQLQKYKDHVLEFIEKRMDMKDLRKHITAEEIITPMGWHQERNVFNGTVFSLAHNILQLLCFRPRNKFEELDGLYLAGAGTHPGSGLPTILESGRIASELVLNEYGIDFNRGTYADLIGKI